MYCHNPVGTTEFVLYKLRLMYCLLYSECFFLREVPAWLQYMTAKKFHPNNYVPSEKIYATGFARRGLIRAPLQNTDFTTILWIHHQTIHVCMFCGQQFTSLLFLRLLSKPCQTAMNARFVLSRLCWLFNKGYQAVRSHTTL